MPRQVEKRISTGGLVRPPTGSSTARQAERRRSPGSAARELRDWCDSSCPFLLAAIADELERLQFRRFIKARESSGNDFTRIERHLITAIFGQGQQLALHLWLKFAQCWKLAGQLVNHV